MAYATIADLRLRLSDLYTGVYTDESGAPMDDEAQADIDAASAEIDTFLGARYETPVTAPAVAALLKTWAVTLAEELAWSRSGKSETPKNVAARVANVRRILQAIADARQSLPGAVERPASSGGGIAFAQTEKPVFSREKLQGY